VRVVVGGDDVATIVSVKKAYPSGATTAAPVVFAGVHRTPLCCVEPLTVCSKLYGG
jgi:hypothetical protein